MYLFLLLLSTSAWAQITDASFFPSVKSINPGVVHMRRGGLISLDYGKRISKKEHTATSAGVVEPITTDVDLTRNTLFLAKASRHLSAEILLNQEKGTREQNIKHPTRGDRKSLNDAASSFYGGILDFRFFGISYANANYSFLDEFRAGNVPQLSALDQDKRLTYTNFKIGSAIKIGVIRLGAFLLNQKASGDFTHTLYDPSTGNKGDTEKFPVSQKAKGFGAGVGFTLNKLRSEISFEKIDNEDFKISESYRGVVTDPEKSSRVTAIAEANLHYFSLGARVRSIKGNYVDLEEIISANLLNDNVGPDDIRNEMTFNFSLGDSNGFSPSLFYTQSNVTTKEKSPVFDNGLKYKAVTNVKAYGLTLSYRF